jgi:hypothetical protein
VAGLAQTINAHLSMFTPVVPCAVPGLAWRIGQAVQVPVVVEFVPESCRTTPQARQYEQQSLAGLTARAALDRLVKEDPRYHWTESDGVVMFRPITAWADKDHFLHRMAPTFAIEELTASAALGVIRSGLDGETYDRQRHIEYGRTPLALKPITVKTGAVSVLDAIAAVVRAHGQLGARITYCKAQPIWEHSTIWLLTYDESGGGAGARPKDANGQYYDACRGGWRF